MAGFYDRWVKMLQEEAERARRARASLLIYGSYFTTSIHPLYDKIVAARERLIKEMSDEELEQARKAAVFLCKDLHDARDVRRAAAELKFTFRPPPPPSEWRPGGKTYPGRDA